MATNTLSGEWFDTKGKMDDEEPATPREVQVLKEFLKGYITSSVAAKGLMTASEEDKPLTDKLNRVAWLLMDTIIHYQTQQPLLIELLDAIHHLPDSELDFSPQQKIMYPDWQDWKGLSRFESLLDDTLRSFWAYRGSPDDEDKDPYECFHNWESVNSFLAHRCLYKKGKDGCIFGVRLIASTLAQESWSNDGERPVESTVLDVRSLSYIFYKADISNVFDENRHTDELLPCTVWREFVQLRVSCQLILTDFTGRHSRGSAMALDRGGHGL